MHTRPTPSGWQHVVDVRLRGVPGSRFTDPLRVLADLEGGLEQPLVEVLERHPDSSVLVSVSVFGDSREPSPGEVAALEGVAAELRFEDSSR